MMLKPAPPPGHAGGAGHGLVIVGAVVIFAVVLAMVVKAIMKGSAKGAGGQAARAGTGGEGVGDMVMNPDKYFFANDEVRIRVATQCAQTIAPVLGGSVRQQESDLQVHGQFQGRSARFEISVRFGSVIVEVRLASRVDVPSLSIEYDKEGRPAREPDAPDEWDQRDRTEQKVFFTPHVRIEGTPDELADKKRLLDCIPEDVRTAVVNALEQQGDGGAGRVTSGGDSVRWFLPPPFLLSKQAPALFTGRLEMLCRFASALEAAPGEMRKGWTATTAQILELRPTGTTINMNPQVKILLDVQGPAGSYKAQAVVVLPQVKIPAFQPGTTVEVRVNPKDPQEITVAV